MPSTATSFISKTLTGADTPKPLSEDNIPFYELNIHCYTNDAYYGDGTLMEAILYADDIISFRNGNLRDIFIQNKTAGNNCSIKAVGTVPSDFVKKHLRW
jgi:hypothetical protein